MTENKFGVITNWCIYENVDGVEKWLNFDEVVDLLNELNNKCEFLEIENESLEDGATRYAELYHKSLKENEQLKSAIKDCIRISESNGALSPMRLKSIFYHFEL